MIRITLRSALSPCRRSWGSCRFGAWTYGHGELEDRRLDDKPLIMFIPRYSFHKRIQESLPSQKDDVIELNPKLSRSMLSIQTCILECLEATVSELKRSSAAVSRQRSDSVLTLC